MLLPPHSLHRSGRRPWGQGMARVPPTVPLQRTLLSMGSCESRQYGGGSSGGGNIARGRGGDSGNGCGGADDGDGGGNGSGYSGQRWRWQSAIVSLPGGERKETPRYLATPHPARHSTKPCRVRPTALVGRAIRPRPNVPCGPAIGSGRSAAAAQRRLVDGTPFGRVASEPCPSLRFGTRLSHQGHRLARQSQCLVV